MPPSAVAQCPRCGRPLRDIALEGLCPACLMRQALAGGSSDDSVIFSSLSPSAWTLVTLMADDEEFVTYLAREHAPDAPEGRGGGRDADASTRLAQLVVRKQHVAASQVGHARQQLERRRDVLRQLTHPALARVLDGGLTEDDHPFLVTTFVMVRPLADLDPEGVDPDSTRQLLDQARDALQALHAAGVVHGRVRASTVLARRTTVGATAVVTGFAPLDRFATLADGIAFDLEQLQRLTSTLRV
jgi:hypothetical protein